MTGKINKTKYFLLALAFVLLILGGCADKKGSLILPDYYNKVNSNIQNTKHQESFKVLSIKEKLAAELKMKKFSDYDELRDFLENKSLNEQMGGYYGRGSAMLMERGVADSFGNALPQMAESKSITSANASTDKAYARSSSDDSYSQTNVQVAGVDEADVVKTDGDYIYALSGQNVYIISARPADKAQITATIKLDSRPQDIYIKDNSLIIFGQDYKINSDKKFNFRRRGSYVFFKVYDINNKERPKQVRDLDFEGGYSNSRLMGDYVYFVTTAYNYYYMEDEPVLPRVIDNGEVLGTDCNHTNVCLSPEVYYFDIPYQNYNFVSVYAINIKEHSKPISAENYLMSANQNMYVSPHNIYLSYTKYISEYDLQMEVMREMVFPRLSQKSQKKIAEIESVPDYILTDSEKNRKINVYIERYLSGLDESEREKWSNDLETAMKAKYKDISKELEKTVIHKVAINKDKLEYQVSGEVTGHIKDQFSMDESGDYLRVATTKGRTWSRFAESDEETRSYNNLYVLDKDLKLVGKVEDLAKGETIRSIRFMQDRAYMVTFKQIDPLFVIGLDNPQKPQVLGYLKIPGYSEYLHPYDDNILIGLGKDAEESEWGGVRTKGLKLSLFDVSDVSKPREIDTYVMGESGSDSPALRDHKAFLFSKDKNLLVIPVQIREETDRGNRATVFSGAAVFNIDKNGFKLKGKISHPGTKGIDPLYEKRYYPSYNSYIKRSFYIDDNLCTFSDNYIKINKLSDLSEIKEIAFPKNRIINPPYLPRPVPLMGIGEEAVQGKAVEAN